MIQEIFCSSFGKWTNHVHYTINSKYNQFWMIYLTQMINTVQSSGPCHIKQDRSSDGYKDALLMMWSLHAQDYACLSHSLIMIGLTGSMNRFYARAGGCAV